MTRRTEAMQSTLFSNIRWHIILRINKLTTQGELLKWRELFAWLRQLNKSMVTVSKVRAHDLYLVPKMCPYQPNFSITFVTDFCPFLFLPTSWFLAKWGMSITELKTGEYQNIYHTSLLYFPVRTEDGSTPPKKCYSPR